MLARDAGRERLLYWLALHLVPGLGARNSLRLIQVFGHPEAIFHASLTELRAAAPRIAKAVAEAIHSGLSFEDAAEELRRVEADGIEVVPYQDPRYPRLLKEIFDPPILLYVRGCTDLLNSHTMAVVGTRRPTAYGRAVAEKLSRDMVLAGLTHVSGMARGIDAISHRGALDGGGSTVAVLGTGVDTPYPRENGKLYDEIVERGLVISQFPLGMTPFPQNFPLRNRIISGMSLGVLVVEGAQYSGSLITARLAMEQDREVMAVPGPITSKPSWGPNLLIKDGAKLVQEAADVIEELPLEARSELRARENAAEQTAAAGALAAGSATNSIREQATPTGRKVLSKLRVEEALHIDEIIRGCEESSSEVLAALSELELLGAVRQHPGKHFVLAWR